MAKYYPRTEKKFFKNVNYTKFFAKEYRAQRKRQDGQVYQAKLRISSIPRSNTTLCVTLLDTQRTKVAKSRSPAGQPVLAPIQTREFLTHFQMDLMDIRNLPLTCSCHCKHNWIFHMIDRFSKNSYLLLTEFEVRTVSYGPSFFFALGP